MHPHSDKCRFSLERIPGDKLLDMCSGVDKKSEPPKQSGSSLKLYSRDGNILTPGNTIVELDGKKLDWVTEIHFDFPATGELPKCTISFLLGKLDIANVEVEKKEV